MFLSESEIRKIGFKRAGKYVLIDSSAVLPEFTVSSGNPAKPILPRDKERLLKNEAEMLRRDAERRE